MSSAIFEYRKNRKNDKHASGDYTIVHFYCTEYLELKAFAPQICRLLTNVL